MEISIREIVSPVAPSSKRKWGGPFPGAFVYEVHRAGIFPGGQSEVILLKHVTSRPKICITERFHTIGDFDPVRRLVWTFIIVHWRDYVRKLPSPACRP
jgi:hypothetical protein